MKKSLIALGLAALAQSAMAQDGQPWIHDPSTIMECDGKYYTYGTGENGIMSEDGWNWHSGAIRPHRCAAPDFIKIGDRYLCAYGTSGGGLGGTHYGIINTMWTKSLDPNSPDMKYTDPVEVVRIDTDDDCDPIDASLMLTPDGRLFMSYGTYFGFIRIVELDPKTGARKSPLPDKNIAIDCEATALINRNGWYYLLGTHGTCCDGVNSTYNIVVGRSRDVMGPYVDNVGRDMIMGGGKMVVAANNRQVGAGHFGRFVECEGLEKTSFHWEADFDKGGRSSLAIRPLLWKNDWPMAGELFQEGVYEITSERRGYALELGVDFVRMTTGRVPHWGMPADTVLPPVKEQTLAEVIGGWSKDAIPARIGDYMGRPHQKWQIQFIPEAGGFLGGQYARISIQGTNKTLAATADGEVNVAPEYNGDASQLWKIEQLVDGTYKVTNKKTGKALISPSDTNPSLGNFDFNNDNCKWNFKRM
ncbi:MAG: family 43 glycosylhydrolase [Bacteroidales bacterium]|nr:family 43 glycosylhydrolase [Bacteroidales bacterium]